MKVLDVNVLVYASDSLSAHHARAREFLDRLFNGDETVVIPWLVVVGFLRIATNPRLFANALTPARAVTVVDGWMSRPNVAVVEPGPEHWGIFRALISETGTAGNLVTDAHLAALAIERGAELCSFDADFARFANLRWMNPARAES